MCLDRIESGCDESQFGTGTVIRGMAPESVGVLSSRRVEETWSGSDNINADMGRLGCEIGCGQSAIPGRCGQVLQAGIPGDGP
jgi:hypothetical protein